MLNMITITTLLENSTVRHNLLSQHGQSLLIELDGKKLIFDVGEVYEGFIYNLEQYKLRLEDITAFIISHRHIDHIGSLTKLLPLLTGQRLLLPTQMGNPDTKPTGPKYKFLKNDENGSCNVAISPEDVTQIMSYTNVEVVSEPMQIMENLWSTGCVGNKMEEQALVYDQKELGLTLIVGCSHPGLRIFVEKAKEITGNDKIRAIIGGFHFNPLSDEEVVEQAKYFDALNLECLMPNHCTGVKQTDLLRKILADKVKISKTYSVGTGNSVSIGDSISLDFV